MERAESLKELKKGVLPDYFVKKFPKEVSRGGVEWGGVF
jgi:hypothetical protein